MDLVHNIRRHQRVIGPKSSEHIYITLHYIKLHYITLHYITLHYIRLALGAQNCMSPEEHKS